MFTIADGRDRFYQWDRDVRLNIDSDKVSQVHFIRSCMKEPLTVKVDTSGDVPSVEVPNILLQMHGGMQVYAYVQNEDSSYTQTAGKFEIQKRPKPVDYIYEPTEVLTFDTLRKELTNKVNLPKDEDGNATHGTTGQVLKTNGDGTTRWEDAEDGMTEEKAAQLTKNTEDISKLSSDKVDKTGITLGTDSEDGLTYIYVDGVKTGDGIDVSSGGGSGVVRYAITYNLTGVSSTNGASSVVEGKSYTTTLSANDGYTLDTPVITMGGVDITESVWNADTATIMIASVVNDVVILCKGNAIPVEIELDLNFVKGSFRNGIFTPSESTMTRWGTDSLIDGTTMDTQIMFSSSEDYISSNSEGIISGICVILYGDAERTDKVGYYHLDVGEIKEISSGFYYCTANLDTKYVIPKGYFIQLVVARNVTDAVRNFASNNNGYAYCTGGFIKAWSVTPTEEEEALSVAELVDNDYAQDYGIATTSLITDTATTTETGIESAFATVIEEAKNAWMLEYNGDINKIPLIIHTDQHSHLSDSGNNMLFDFVSEIVNWYEISKVVNLGDTANRWTDADTDNPLTECTALEGYLEAMKEVPYSKRIEVFGNHDTWGSDESGATIGLTPQAYLHKYYKNIYARQKDNYGNFVVKDDYYNVKYVVVSGFAYDSNLGGYSHYVIPSDSIDWIISELEKADGYDVIILSHVPLGSGTTTIYNPIDGTSTEGSVGGVNYKLLTDLWRSRKSKTSGSVIDEYSIAHEFDFTGCDGELLCGLHGHTHADGYYYIGDLLDAYFDAFYISPNAFYFVLVDRTNSQLNVWKVDNTPQCQNYQVPFDKPVE